MHLKVNYEVVISSDHALNGFSSDCALDASQTSEISKGDVLFDGT